MRGEVNTRVRPSNTSRRRAFLLLAVIASAASLGTSQVRTAEDEGVVIHNGFGTARSYLDEMSTPQRRAYAMGFINGMLVAPMFGGSKTKLLWLERCVEQMTDDQVSAIVLKHVRDHPERWHYGLHMESWTAMKDACGAT